MGYRAKKLKSESKLKRIKIILFTFCMAIVFGVCIFAHFVPAETWKYRFGMPELSVRQEGELRIHFIDVGQGDATLIEFPDGKTALIDGGRGGEVQNKALMRYLNALKIEYIDSLVLTHADVDHYGGLRTVLQYKEVGTAYLPMVENPLSVRGYAAFYRDVVKNGCEVAACRRGEEFVSTGGYDYNALFLYPYTFQEEDESEKSDGADGEEDGLDENGESAVVWLEYCGVSAIFCGDIGFETENYLIRDDKLGLLEKWQVKLAETEILKVAHHGSESSTSLGFLQYLGVKTAVISCGADNAYGHPSDTVLKNLATQNVESYRTDEDGSVMITIKPDGTYQAERVG